MFSRFLGLALFFVALTQAQQPSLSLRLEGGNQVVIGWPSSAQNYALEQSSNLALSNGWQQVPTAATLENDEFTITVNAQAVAQFFRLRSAQEELVSIESTSPFDGETDVSVTRESIVRFSGPLAEDTVLDSTTFYAMAAGRRILSRVEISSDRKRLTLFYLEPLPGGAEVNVFLDLEDLFDAGGSPVDHNILSFSTLSLTPVALTAVIGTVYAVALAGGSGGTGTNQPLAGVTITVDGMEQTLRTVTDANGKFTLSPVPPGRFFVHIDGRTAVNDALGIRYPDKSFYPFVGKAWNAIAGRQDNLAGDTGTIFLPLILAGTLQPVSQTAATTISFPPSVVASNPSFSGVSITVPANSLFSDNGTRGGKVGIAPVPPDRLPGPLPPGLELPIVITVQSDGALNFDQPAPVCFPNVTDPVFGAPLPAGSKQSLMSFNHRKGVWESVGTMTVSTDGKLVCSDPGFGILQPGWHGVGPPPSGPPPPPCGDGGSSASPFALTRSSAHGTIVALDTEAQCEQKCADDLAARLKRANDGEIDTLGRCVKYASNHICPYVQGIIDTYQSDREVAQALYDQCVAGCKTNPPPSPPPPKPPKPPAPKPKKPASCRPKKKSAASLSNASFIRAQATSLSDETIVKIEGIADQISALVAPYSGSGAPWPDAVEQQIADLFANANALAGGNASAYIENYLLQAEVQDAANGTLNEPDGNAPDYPVFYAAEVLRPGGLFYLRGQTEPFGQYELFIPRDGQLLSVRFYDAQTKSYDIVYPRLRPDAPWRLPSFQLVPIDATFPDADHDGVPDVVELVFGTDPHNADSDGDGIPDGAEIDQGTNPLDGRPAQTGIISAAATPGAAVDLSVAEGQVLTAEGTSGVSLFSTYNGANPVLLAHFVTGANVQRVALSPPLALAVEPDLGLSIVDFSTLSTPRLLYTVQFPAAQAVATDGFSAYVGTGAGYLYEIDLGSGQITRDLSVTNAIRDVALSQGYLYALTDQQLLVVSITNRTMVLTKVVNSPYPSRANLRLFAGGMIAYAVHGTGFNTFDLTNPANPVLTKAGPSSEFGWEQLVANGTGLALAAVGPNSPAGDPHDISLYDVSNPTNAFTFLTTFPMPGVARAVAIWNGYGYAAVGTAGLQVINYLPFDTKAVPPSVTFSNLPPSAFKVVENSKVTFTATAFDDVQVRNVEFYLDDTLIQTDGNFPFEFTFIAPRWSADRSTYRLRARAYDMAGNFGWSEEVLVTILVDSTPPEVSGFYPRSLGAQTRTVTVDFSEAMDPASLTSSSFRLLAAGPDGISGTVDDVEVLGGVRTLRTDGSGAILQLPTPLALGSYRIIASRDFTDLRTNHLAADVIHDFRVINAIYWSSPAGGDWSNPANWSTAHVPGTNDDVLIASATAGTITFSQGQSSVKSLLAENLLVLSSGRLEIRGTFQADNFELSGGTLAGARVVPSDHPIEFRIISGTFDHVILDADAAMENADRVNVLNGLTVNGKLTITSSPNYTGISLNGPQTVDGTGQIIFSGSSPLGYLQPNAALTIGTNLTLRGGNSYIGANGIPLTNHGTILADVNGQTLHIQGQPFLNTGTIASQNGGSLSIEANWTNAGLLRVTQSTLAFAGTFSTAGLGTIQGTGGTFLLQGDLNNTNSTLALDNSMGSWVLDRGKIHGGRITVTDPGVLKFNDGTLDGVTLDSDFALNNFDRFTALNSLTVNGKLTITSSPNYTGISLNGPQTVDGTGQIIFSGSSPLGYLQPNAALTIGTNLTLRGGNSYIGANGIPLTNHGTILADVNGQALHIQGQPFVNTGTLASQNGGSLSIEANWTNAGLLRVTQSTLAFAGTFSTAGLGTIQGTGGTFLLQGDLNNTNSTLALDNSIGSWVLDRGKIHGGRITVTDPGVLKFNDGTLDGVTLDSDFALNNFDRFTALGGLTVNGKLTITSSVNYTGIIINGPQTLDGTGQIIFSGSSPLGYLQPNAALTIGTNLTLRGGNSYIGANGIPLTNHGTILADVNGQTLHIVGNPLVNLGTAQALNGGVLSVEGNWSNAGIIKLTQATLDLAGTFDTAGLGTIQNNGGSINIQGVLNNTNSTLALTDALGSWVLDAGTIRGGSISASSVSNLRFKSATLDGVAFDSDFALQNFDQITALDGLTVNHSLTLFAAANYTGINFHGTQTLGGTGQIIFGTSSSLNFLQTDAALTIGPALMIHGGTGSIGAKSVPLTNLGTIIADVANGVISVYGTPFVNSGSTNIANGGQLLLNP